MQYEFIVQKETYKAKIAVVPAEYGYGEWKYRIYNLSILPKGKRKWISVTHDISDRYDYRNLKFNSEDRQRYILERYLEYVTEEDIQNAVNYAYEQLKPELNKIEFRA